MTRTIEERIEEVIDDLPGVADLSVHDFKRAFQRHFCEPWLDKPDGPGWWWYRCEGGQSAHYIVDVNDILPYYLNIPGGKWQRAIGPM